MRLALAMGEPDVIALQERVTYPQFVEWCAFLAVEPTGWEATRMAAGTIAATVAGSVPRQPTKAKPLHPGDFFPEPKPRKVRKPADPKAMEALLRSLAAQGIGTFVGAK